MNRLCLICFAFVFISGCGGGTFIDLGNGAGVPTGAIDDYAEEYGISRDEAKKQMLAESNQERQIRNGDAAAR